MRDEIIINGIKYDAKTGIAIEKVQQESFENFGAEKIHQNLQKSQTLNRKFVRRPQNLTNEQIHAIEQFKRRHDYMEFRKSQRIQAGKVSHSKISSFEGVRGSTSRVISPISVRKSEIKKVEKEQISEVQAHPTHQKVLEKMREEKSIKTLPTAQEIKDSAIVEAFEKSREMSKKQRGVRKKFFLSKRFVSFLACCVVICMSAGYLTYVNMPNISTRIAAAQSGIDATLPHYVAQGYSLNGLAFFDGKSVNLKYKNGENGYTVKQASTSWDSVALLENYVEEKWDKDYSTYLEKGLTIYKNRNNEAAWVNNGKIYTIDGSNKLSNEEIRKIATSF